MDRSGLVPEFEFTPKSFMSSCKPNISLVVCLWVISGIFLVTFPIVKLLYPTPSVPHSAFFPTAYTGTFTKFTPSNCSKSVLVNLLNLNGGIGIIYIIYIHLCYLLIKVCKR